MSGTTSANTTTFGYTGQIVTFTAPATGVYDIVASGASGFVNGDFNTHGGLGAEIGGDVTLTAGETLQIAVGGAGSGNGDGGGSFVVGPDNTPLVIAGGGGGEDGDQFSEGGSGGGGGGGGYSGGSGGNGTTNIGNTGGGGGGSFLTASATDQVLVACSGSHQRTTCAHNLK